jgi:hypothetical protein
MYRFKPSIRTLVVTCILIGALIAFLPLVGKGQVGQNPLTKDPRRSFYLTQSSHNAGQALLACAQGYHMASLWEIFDTSNLRYNTELGFTRDDSGFGPPTFIPGWIRTGTGASADAPSAVFPGTANCGAWTTADPTKFGTVVHVAGFPWNQSNLTIVSPWQPDVKFCSDASPRVWCVQD